MIRAVICYLHSPPFPSSNLFYIIGLKEGLNESFNGTESDDDLHIEQSVDEEQMEHEDGLDAQNLVLFLTNNFAPGVERFCIRRCRFKS